MKKKVLGKAAVDADLFEIKPAVKYTKADLNWMDKKSRSSVEMNNKSFRPEIVDGKVDATVYDTVFVGFPIWWYVAPTFIAALGLKPALADDNTNDSKYIRK